ncbi:flagellar motor protein MotB [Providencia sneebia]|uniref:Flagellar motor protein MotB n=1 Tax=Providencia sneebia DSM 19967 TaxID=1141660 RepID=K8WD38_9GAMM|nr:flagellar motor protein MotB [Providencia sneebia]EKT58548.1 flagellar motor protein MotB [Providencia sneebia DSM 19967]
MKVNPESIIRIRKRVGRHSHYHSGSWKIAYADFMTAMMAFFLVMWLISISSPQQLTQLAEYFRTPLRTAINSGSQSGDSINPTPAAGKDIIFRDSRTLVEINDHKSKQKKYHFERLKKSLNQAILSDPRLNRLKPHLFIDIVDEGLRLQIVDSVNRPMFMIGSAQVEPYMRDILHAIAPLLNAVPNKISLSGHTDDLPYINEKNYSNWELSVDRANTSRRELIIGGLNPQKILRVVGMASSVHLDKNNGLSPINRRISIIVLSDIEEKQLLHEFENEVLLNEISGSRSIE